MTQPTILITNDDGYLAQGIQELTELMRPLGRVVVVVPDSARSGASCSITCTQPVSVRLIREEKGLQIWACSGTPVDCVKIACDVVLPDRLPDLVVSGINHGDNASISVHYSGTMGAAKEACMKGLPAIGYSLRDFSQQCNFAPFRKAIVRVARTVLRDGLPQGTCLNVNFPVVEELQGIRVCRMARGQWVKEWAVQSSSEKEKVCHLTGYFQCLEPEAEDCDIWALDHGFASVVPIAIDETDSETLKTLSCSQ